MPLVVVDSAAVIVVAVNVVDADAMIVAHCC